MATAIDIVLNAINKTGGALGEVSADLDDIGTSADRAGSQLRNIGSSAAKVGAGLTAGVTLPLAAVGVSAVNAASDLQETIGKVDVVFGDQSAAMQAWADNAAIGLGASKQEALDMASSLAILGNALEVSGDDSAAWAQEMSQRAADMGSFFNSSTQEAADAMAAALKGNFEQMEKYGVVMSAASVSQRAMEMGLADTVTELSAQDKALAAQAIIMEQTSMAAGNFADTSDGLANSSKIVQAQLATLSADLGTVLLPTIEKIVGWVGQMVQGFSGMPEGMQQAIVVGMAVAAALGPLITVIGGIVTAVGAVLPLFAALGTALGVILSPIGLVVGAVAALVALMFNLGGANDLVATKLQEMGFESAANAVRGLHEWTSELVETIGQLFSGEMTFSEFFSAAVPEWITELMNWSWPILAPVAWVNKLFNWAWPKMDRPDWINNLFNFRWPKFPSRPGWLGGKGDEEDADAVNSATGTGYHRGGLTWVGETGPELVNLPRGSQIIPSMRSAQMAAAAGGININITANVTNDADITTLTRRIARELQRRGG